jgi:hypothetical protein
VLPLFTMGCGAAQGHLHGYAFEASALNVVSESAIDWAEPEAAVAAIGSDPAPAAVRTGGPAIAAAPQRPEGGRSDGYRSSGSSGHGRSSPPPTASRAAEAARASSAASQPAPAVAPDLRAVQRVEAAQALLGTPGLQDRAFVAHVLRAAAQDIAVDSKAVYAAALWGRVEPHKLASTEVRPGDLVFFRDTADINGNGKADDGVTMVGLVEQVRGQHVIFIAQRAGKVRRLAVDASRPLVIRDPSGEVINTRLVRWPGSEQAWTTGQCLSGFARPR